MAHVRCVQHRRRSLLIRSQAVLEAGSFQFRKTVIVHRSDGSKCEGDECEYRGRRFKAARFTLSGD
jgi:hypothetical protein